MGAIKRVHGYSSTHGFADGCEMSLDDIADQLDISRQAASQAIQRAVRRIWRMQVERRTTAVDATRKAWLDANRERILEQRRRNRRKEKA